MYGGNWYKLRFWRWWFRNRAPTELVMASAALLALAVLGTGYYAAARLSGPKPASAEVATFSYDTTVQRLVTVREKGRPVIKRVPVVVRHVLVRPVTEVQTLVKSRVVTKPGGVKVVQRRVIHYVPVVHKQVVTRNGKTTTVTKTRLVPTVQTQTQVVTNQQTVVNQNTVTVTANHTVTQPVTTTLPVTVTHTTTETQTQTQTVVQTTTVQLPAQTVTVTVTTTGP